MSSDNADSTLSILAPPFVTVDGILNVRSVGGYSIISGDSDESLRSLIVKPTYLFRAAEPTRVTELGKAQLRALGVKKIFDFRSDSEIQKYKAVTPEFDGITIVRAPVSDDEAYDPASLALRVQAFETDTAQAFAQLYEGILDLAGPAFAKVLHHIRDNPDEPCLVHCTAGKDRTGVFAAVFLKFLGVSDEDIAKDYSLTEIGLKPMMPLLVARYRNEPVFKDKWEVTMKMASAKPETILATLDTVHKKYGGVESYLKEKAGLTDEDLEAIKKNVLAIPRTFDVVHTSSAAIEAARQMRPGRLFDLPENLSESDCQTIFGHLFRRLAAYRQSRELYALAEYGRSTGPESKRLALQNAFLREIDLWAQALLENAWFACQEPGGGSCPELGPLSDSSIGDLPRLPPIAVLSRMINIILFIHITTSKSYSPHTRSFLSQFSHLDEHTIAATLKNPEGALKEAEQLVQETKDEHAVKGKTFRMVGMGLGAIAGGVLVGVTGGLAAPLVGAGVTALFGALGVGGTAVGLLASGLASSSVVCGALFGAYGAQSTAGMVGRYTREIRDLAVLPVRRPEETLAVRLCVSGWLTDKSDVTAPWTVFEGDDTYALQWEVEALEQLSSALYTLVRTSAMRYVKAELIKRTFLASLMSSLAPIAWLNIGRIIDNPWMNAKSLALKAGSVLATLLSSHAFGTRPVSLTGYSLGALVIFEALTQLAALPPSRTTHLIADVFLFGAPVPADGRTWSAVRRLVAGRLINGYAANDYVLAVLARATDASWNVAGLQIVDVQGVENVCCDDAGVDGHLKWRGMVGRCLEMCGAPGVNHEEVERQTREVVRDTENTPELTSEEIGEATKPGLNEKH